MIYTIVINFVSFRVKKEEVSQMSNFLLKSLFATLSLPGSAENEYVMKGMFVIYFFTRVFWT